MRKLLHSLAAVALILVSTVVLIGSNVLPASATPASVKKGSFFCDNSAGYPVPACGDHIGALLDDGNGNHGFTGGDMLVVWASWDNTDTGTFSDNWGHTWSSPQGTHTWGSGASRSEQMAYTYEASNFTPVVRINFGTNPTHAEFMIEEYSGITNHALDKSTANVASCTCSTASISIAAPTSGFDLDVVAAWADSAPSGSSLGWTFDNQTQASLITIQKSLYTNSSQTFSTTRGSAVTQYYGFDVLQFD